MARRFEDRSYTLEQYFELERNSDQKHEFFQGQIYLMTGGSANHNLIGYNIAEYIGNALEDKPCRVFGNNLQVFIKGKELVTYPDIFVVCGPLDFVKGDRNVVANPIMIAEVLSPSTAHYDERNKFNPYKKLATFEDYLLADSRKMEVIYYHKIGANNWAQQVFSLPHEVIILQSLNIELSLAQIYNKVDFDSEPIPLHPTENS